MWVRMQGPTYRCDMSFDLEDDGILSGAAADQYRQPFDGKCWWCGAPADSREHKFKRTDLARMMEAPSDYLMWGGTHAERMSKITGTRSGAVKFPAHLCTACNNERSQPFDGAYDQLADFVWNNTDRLVESASGPASGLRRRLAQWGSELGPLLLQAHRLPHV
jgi:hypothetical protein